MYDPRFLIAWLVVLLSGGALELVALFRRGTPDTLSELVWMVLRMHRAYWFIGALFMGWLSVHFLSFGMYP